MKIYSMTATFGKLENQTLTFAPGLNVIEKPNEWGKSTWCAFLTAMLYGVDTAERNKGSYIAVKERYAPWTGSPMAGRMDLCWNGRDITVERSTKGRIPMGEFKAYETASGVAVPELTADNCGKLLLGVEKSVFVRTGFVRLSDMPVTQDEALRRRLNELVTTGDESGQSDDLAEKLRDLKNKVHLNRSKGLIPQALVEKTDLEEKLQQLSALQSQSQNLQQRQEELSAHAARLKNHKNALAWNAAQSRMEKLSDTKARLHSVTEQVCTLENACAALPDEATLQSQLDRAKDLQNQKDSLQLELAMLPAPPTAPQGLAPHDPVQAKKDFETYTELSAVAPPAKGLKIGAIIAAIAALAGIALTFATRDMLVPPILGAVIFAGFGITAGICGRYYRRGSMAYAETQQQLQELTGRYAPLPAEQWVSAAESYVNQQGVYQAALAAHEQRRTDLQQRLQQVMTALSSLPATDGHRDAMEKRRALTDARREQQHLAQLVQTLESADPLPEKPEMADDMLLTESETLTQLSNAELESRQLHNRLGQVQGQMETLGSAAVLQEQLSAVNDRLAKLEQTYKALELAQTTLTQASTELQRRFAPTITQKAREHFARITGGRYDKLTLTQELTVETATADEPAVRKSQFRSDGTVDQLYLSLRLAVAEALTPEAPLVLDDALVRFDDKRLAETLALLTKAAQTKQVILFTCQSREAKHA